MLNFKKYLFEILPLRNFIDGFVLSNDTSDLPNSISVSPGAVCNSTNDDLIRRSSLIIKKLNAVWVAGSGVGGLDTGTKVANTTYHIFAIKKIDGTTDVIMSLDPSSPLMPTGYVHNRRVGSIITDGSGAIRQFVQTGDTFRLVVPHLVINAPTGSASGLLLAVGVPTGVKMEAHGFLGQYNNGDGVFGGTHITSPDMVNTAPNQSYNGSIQWAQLGVGGGRPFGQGSTQGVHGSYIREITDTSGRLRFTSTASNILPYFHIAGWRDFRGQQ